MIPLDAEIGFLQLVNGAISLLLDPANYEVTPGGLTIQATIDHFNVMFSGYLEGCVDMIGSIFPTARGTLPDGQLWCDGTSYLREDYPQLYAVLDAAFIVDADHFITPDMRGRVPHGANVDFAPGVTGGARTHLLTTNELAAHAHTVNLVSPVSPAHGHTAAQITPTSPAHTHTRQSDTLSIPNHSHDLAASVFFGVRETASAFVSGSGLLQRGSATTTNSQVQVDLPSRTEVESMTLGGAVGANNNATVTINPFTPTINNGTATITPFTPTMQNAGGGVAHNNMPPYMTLKFAIIARQ